MKTIPTITVFTIGVSLILLGIKMSDDDWRAPFIIFGVIGLIISALMLLDNLGR